MNFKEQPAKIPDAVKDRVEWGLYGGQFQFFINGVDGTLAILGQELPATEKLLQWIASADREHNKLVSK